MAAAFRQTLVCAITASSIILTSALVTRGSIRAEVFVQFDTHTIDKPYPHYFERQISSIIHHDWPSRFPQVRQRARGQVRSTSFRRRPDKEVFDLSSIHDVILIALYSVSGDAAYRSETIAMGHWLDNQLQALGVTTVLRDLGQQTLQGQRLDLPPAILGKLGDDPKKKTVLIYGHYDVQPVSSISASGSCQFGIGTGDALTVVGRCD